MGDILKYLPIFVYMINHDDLILKILSNKCGYIDSNKLRKINIKYPLIKYYLENRFDYIENLNEAFNRIKYHTMDHVEFLSKLRFEVHTWFVHDNINILRSFEELIKEKLNEHEQSIRKS